MNGSLRSPPLDCSLVAPNLFVGARPPFGRYRWINVIALCAREFQPPSYLYPGVTVLHVPLADDLSGMGESDQMRAVTNARTIARYLQGGSRVLVTCHQGLNRSALVAGLAMHLTFGMGSGEVIKHLREARSTRCLGNPHFVELLEDVERR